MKLLLGMDNFQMSLYPHLINDLANYASCVVTRENNTVTVELEGDVVECMCVVSVCDRYRFKEVGE